MTENTKQDENNTKVPSDGTVWPPPPDNQKETALSGGSSSPDTKPNYPLALLKGAGLNFVLFWFFTLPGSALFPSLASLSGTADPRNRTYFWICWGLALAISTIGFALVPKNKVYGACLILGAILMSVVSLLFNSFITGISI